MANVQRYDFKTEYGNGQGTIFMQGERVKNGRWVNYQDHKRIVDELEKELESYKDAYLFQSEHIALLNS